MTKKQKIDYINQVNERFKEARNHGHNGNNWWYPKENRIAYNVKLYNAGKSIEDMRKKMTDRQNDYYNDDRLYEIYNEKQSDDATMFSDDLDLNYGVKSGYAGRSGGWLEVDYDNPLTEVDDETSATEVNDYCQEAKKLDKLEKTIATHIESSLDSYKKYIASNQFCVDFVNNLLSDDDIADTYKGRIKSLTDKLK